MLNNQTKNSITLNKGEYVVVNRLVDAKHYFIYEIKVNSEEKGYLLDGDYTVINRDLLF